MLQNVLFAIFIIVSPVLVPLILIFLLVFGLLFYNIVFKKRKLSVRVSKYKRPGIFNRLFVQFPHQLVEDMFNNDPNAFREFGLHMFCGEQGSGKTISVIQKLHELKQIYPLCKIRTNVDYKYQDGVIDHWKTLVHNENGVYGQVEVLDEIQAWFSSLQSKDFPPEMLTEISQQRKQRKMLIGTAQVFSRIAKPIREQTTFVYLPMTILGCLTWVRVSKPQFWDDEKQIFKRYIRHYFFVHSPFIRDSFDTYEKVEKYKEGGFKDDTLRLISNQ